MIGVRPVGRIWRRGGTTSENQFTTWAGRGLFRRQSCRRFGLEVDKVHDSSCSPRDPPWRPPRRTLARPVPVSRVDQSWAKSPVRHRVDMQLHLTSRSSRIARSRCVTLDRIDKPPHLDQPELRRVFSGGLRAFSYTCFMEITIQLPPNVDASQARQAEHDAREAVGVRLYSSQTLSHGQLATFLGISRAEVDDVLSRHSVADEFTADEIAEQATSLRRLREGTGRARG